MQLGFCKEVPLSGGGRGGFFSAAATPPYLHACSRDALVLEAVGEGGQSRFLTPTPFLVSFRHFMAVNCSS
jgi:hypothetical protein